MALTVGHSSAVGFAQLNLSKSSDKLTRISEQLASGLRINRAWDDAAGLQLASKLRADYSIANLAVRNASDGISLVAVADAGLESIGTILGRMAELATQSANGIYTNSSRSALSQEFIALGSEIERIAKTTTFNGLALLSGGANITLQVGIDGTANSRLTLNAVSGTLTSLSLAGSNSSALTSSIIANTDATSQTASQAALTKINSAITTLNTARGTLGAVGSRLNSAVDNLSVMKENFAAAESRIRDIDVAEATAEFTRVQILRDVGSAMLSHSKQDSQLVLRLLS